MLNLLPHGGTVSRNMLWVCRLIVLFLGGERFSNWLFSGSELIFGGIRTA